MFKKIAAAMSFLLATSAVQAANYKVEFSMSGFGPVAPGMAAAPFDRATGTVVFSASSPTSDWGALKEFSLTIGDISYSLMDAEFVNYGSYTTVGGSLDSPDWLQSGTNDFALSVFYGDGSATLTYSSLATPGYWYTGSSVAITELAASAVPEVETYAMLLAGLGMMGVVARRRRTV